MMASGLADESRPFGLVSTAGPSAGAPFLAGSAGLPRPLDVEVPRLRLVQRLAQRWDRPITLVVAGPGFGKTTVLAQAVRAHLAAPRGIDVWLSCEAAYEDPVRFAQALLDAMSAGRGHEQSPTPCRRADPGAREVIDTVIRWAPLEVCLLLDDVHEIPVGSPGAALLRDIAAALPATAHLVLSGRVEPPLPLARREAAGEVVRVSPADLAFTDVEVAALARRLGRDASAAAALQGWPALVRLAFAAGSSAPWRYAREEILGRLPGPQCRALAALAALGSATTGEVAAVTGGPVALDDLVRRIPLVDVLADGRYRAHDLWTDAVSRAMTVQETHLLRRRAVITLMARGDLARAGRLACQSRNWDLLADLAVELVHTTLSALPRSIAERWLAAVPPSMADEPAFVLLAAAVTHAGDFTDPSIDPMLDQAWQGMLDRDDEAGATAVLGQATITAHSRADLARLAALAGWSDRLDAPFSPVLRLLRHNVAAMHAEVLGDPEGALVHLVQAPVLGVPAALALSTWRFHYHCLNMCGRCGAAAELADRTLADASDALVALSGAVARWFDGDPSDLGRLRGSGRAAAAAWRRQPNVDPVPATARDAFVAMALAAVIASCCGEVSVAPELPCGNPTDKANPRDAILACAAQAAIAVARGDECTAREAYARQLTGWPIENRFTERHLRRFLALGYVVNERLRVHWDGVDLGPSHLSARAAARALLRARAGDLTAAGRLPPAHALCFLPLPWSVELAARLAADDHPAGLELGRWLADTIGPAVHRQFRATSQAAEEALATGATRLLAALPAPPTHRIRIEVMGTMRLTRDGVPVDAPQLRRLRVRQLLSALALDPVVVRDKAIELLWPGLAPASAARNLRVTLTYLRQLLEPDRSGGDASFHLRTNGDTIRLIPSGSLSVDLWTYNQLAERIDQARADGDNDRAADLLGEAIALWRGDLLPDLRDLCDPDVAIEVDRVRARHVRDLLALGELRLVAGDTAEAARLATRALSVEPYDSRGHRLVLAAALRGRKPAHIAAARDRVLAALRQLAAAPDPATAILLRQTLPPPPDRAVRSGGGAGRAARARCD
ncbi:MAG TPA: BTAD domain-containing putative transcriptional regulator [Actinophytocola sp.]|uniref:BTAD domain-containing putative transcriptional regulator n=1 Tax=Actinophytocola sp. TaxID=1872138 RepID=UPI002DBA379B|nr:BTAD domain-containing putative transcriptional regulator [Actinophytocola sp.]HEU5474710.1 BTAD domain-containing putative transcriptional regulator [Actinophytocola sp.]